MTDPSAVGLFAWYVVPLVLFALFLIAFKVSRTKLIAGLLFSCSLISFLGILMLQAYLSDIYALRVTMVLVFLPIILLMGFGVYMLIAFLVWNTRSILKRETRTLKHVLTFILAIALTLFVILTRFVDFSDLPPFLQYFAYTVYVLVIYYFLHLSQFIVSVVLCNCTRPRKDQDYIIVLGAWINEGKVPPLLARRIDKAVAFYRMQEEVGSPPKLVLSGGQGSDESCPEAEAMKAYAMEKGIPSEHILLETKSTSTLENMRFSKEIMDEDFHEASHGAPAGPYRCIFATNNYHVMRAGIVARKAGLKIDGIGARTAFYYLPNAILREYLAYLYIHMKWHIAFVSCILVIGSIVFPLADYYLTG